MSIFNSKIMIQKFIFALVVSGFMSFGYVAASIHSASYQAETLVEESVSYEMAVAVCKELDKSEVLTYDAALNLYKSGTLTITKISSGKYSVVYPGGFGDIILITEI